jgi:hypothetical protein
MGVRYTSVLALSQIVRDLGGLQREVYQAIKDWNIATQGPGPSIEDLHVVLRKKESSICGRVNELKKAGCIVEGPMKVNSLSSQAHRQFTASTYIALEFHPPVSVAGLAQDDLFAGERRPGVAPFIRVV